MLAVLSCAGSPADAPIAPRRICDIVRNLSSLEGATVAALGRYSHRTAGNWLEEQACDAASAIPPSLWLEENPEAAPKPEGSLDLDAAAIHRELVEVRKRTSLGKFRFGSSDYDRWAAIYGRVETRLAADQRTVVPVLVFRGSGVVVWLTPDD